MSKTFRRTAAALGAGALLAVGLAATQATAGTPTTATATASATGDTAVADALAFSREEERMARDLYAALATTWDGARPFSMITTSEDRHFDAVGALLERHDVTDPSAGQEPGTYAIPAIQDLYDGWLAEGRTSLEAAYRVGVELEQRDIADLEQSIAADLPSDVDAVLGRLLDGSQNHFAAYQRAVDGDLGTGTGMRGTRNGNGGKGNGSGNGNGVRGGRGVGTGGDCPYTEGAAA